MPTRTFMTIPQPLRRGRRRAVLQWRAALPVVVLVGATKPRAAALGLASIKHAKLKARMAAWKTQHPRFAHKRKVRHHSARRVISCQAASGRRALALPTVMARGILQTTAA